MLILSALLVAVDFFLGEAIVSANWKLSKHSLEYIERLKQPNINTRLIESGKNCQIQAFSKKHRLSINENHDLLINKQSLLKDTSAKALLCSIDKIYLLTDSNYNAVLYQLNIKSEKNIIRTKIISKLRYINKLYLLDDIIYLEQKSKNRLLALSNIVSKNN